MGKLFTKLVGLTELYFNLAIENTSVLILIHIHCGSFNLSHLLAALTINYFAHMMHMHKHRAHTCTYTSDYLQEQYQ